VAFIGEVAQAQSDTVSASGHNDRRVRSVRRQPQLVSNGYFVLAAYKYLLASFGGDSLGLFDSLTSS
jgi:hypothetical protein